jgi:D-alanyl-D-alanine carboxypeptidase
MKRLSPHAVNVAVAFVAATFLLYFAIPTAAVAAADARSAAATQPTALDRALDKYVQEKMRSDHIVGLSLAVMKDGQVIKVKGYGFANIETHTPATPNTAYKIASISKQFLASAIMLLVAEGKVSLDDPVSKYLPDVPESWKAMKVRHVLNHTSGLPPQRDKDDPPGFEPYKSDSDIDTIRRAYPVPLGAAPGDQWHYSNLGYFVVGEIITQASGQPWSDFIASRIFSPVGMTATRTTSTTDIIPNRSAGYEIKDGKLINAENWIALRPSGAFFTTVLDMAKWDVALYTDKVISSSMRDQMWALTTLTDGTSVQYGLGWFTGHWNNGLWVSHSGGTPGFVSEFERFVDARLSVIVLMNTTSGSAVRMARHIALLYDPKLKLRPIPDDAPEVTAQLRTVLEQLTAGTLQHDALTQHYAALAIPDQIEEMQEYLRPMGPATSMTLVDSWQSNGEWSRRYRITYKNNTVIWKVAVMADRKVADMQFGAEYSK